MPKTYVGFDVYLSLCLKYSHRLKKEGMKKNLCLRDKKGFHSNLHEIQERLIYTTYVNVRC